MNSDRIRRLWAAAGLVVLVLGAVALRWGAFDHRIEDAYISFRYAAHWAEGLGPVYNPGERVEGYSNFLWVALLALAGWLGISIPEAARWGGLLFGLLCLNESRLLARSLLAGAPAARAWSWAPPLALAAWPYFAAWPLSGMETTAFAFFLSRGLRLYLELWQAPGVKGVPLFGQAPAMLALACLTRPEGLYFALGASAVVHVRRLAAFRSLRALIDRREVWTLWVPVLIFYSWKFHYYGALLPNSFGAKYGLGTEHAGVGLGYLVKFLWGGWGWWAILPCAALLVFNAARAARPAVLLSLGFIAVVGYMGGDIYPFARYLAPLMPALLALAAAALGSLWAAAGPRPLRWAVPAYALVGLGLVFPPGAGAERRLWEGLRTNDEARREFALRVGPSLASPGPLAIQDAGIIPFYLDIPVVDMLGLNDAHIAARRIPFGERGAFGHEKHDAGYVLARRPDMVFFVLHHWTPGEVRVPGIDRAGPLPFPATLPLVLLRFDELPAQTTLWEEPEFKWRYRPVVLDYADKRIVLYRLDSHVSALVDHARRPLTPQEVGRLVSAVMEKGIYAEGAGLFARFRRKGIVDDAAVRVLDEAVAAQDPSRMDAYRRQRSDLAARHLQKAQEAEARGDAEEALRILARAARLYPEDRGVARARADRWLAGGHPREAWALYRRLLSGEGAGPDLWCRAGEALRAAGERERAVEHLRRALALDPHYLPAREALGTLGY